VLLVEYRNWSIAHDAASEGTEARLRISWRTILICTTVAILSIHIQLSSQQRLSRSVTASGDTLPAWASQVDVMLGDGSLDISEVQPDTMIAGRTHERLNQHHEGLPVFGGQVVRQMDGRRILSVFGRLFENVSVPTTIPSMTAAAAARIAERVQGQGAVADAPELGILPKADGYVLVYRMKVRSAWDIQTYFVNVGTGAVEDHVSRIRRQGASTVGKGTGVLNDQKKVSAAQASGTFQAIDLLRPADAVTLDFHGSFARLNDFFLQNGSWFPSDVATSTSNSWTDGAVVDAHVYQGWVYDYYFKRFGRQGLDGQNIEIVGVVHPLARTDAALYPPDIVDTFINNALYLGDGFMMYGDGDGQVLNYLAGGLDVIGHELTHGVTDFTSQLDFQDEPGALNEAFSDIMATSVEFFYERSGQGPQKGPNFLIGEDVYRPAPGFLRSLQNPIAAGNPDHYSLRQFIGTDVDDGGVHVNSTIVGHAFYLAVAGGQNRVSGITVPGVGLANMDRVEKIFYRAFTFYLGPQSQFSDARAATLQAATDLYGPGSNERAQVLQAWSAVGVP